MLCIANFQLTFRNWVTTTKASSENSSDAKTFELIYGSCKTGFTVSLWTGHRFCCCCSSHITFCVGLSSVNVLFSFNELICMCNVHVSIAMMIRRGRKWAHLLILNIVSRSHYATVSSVHGYGNVHNAIISLQTHKFKLKKHFFFSFCFASLCVARLFHFYS